MNRRRDYLRGLPKSLLAEVERRAKEDGITVDRFVATAVAEKLSAMNVADFFAERRERADWERFDLILRRSGGEPPREGDELPADE